MGSTPAAIPILDLHRARDPKARTDLIRELHSALFDVGFLYLINHDVPRSVITRLTDFLPALFALGDVQKQAMSKLNSPHFLGYSGLAEETTLGKTDHREQFDFATELPVVYQEARPQEVKLPCDQTARDTITPNRDFTRPFWRLRGPNQWPEESQLPGFRQAMLDYHDAVEQLSFRFVHLVEEALGIPGTFNHFFGRQQQGSAAHQGSQTRQFLPPQHRIKLLRYPPTATDGESQGVGAHKDSSGWLTFLYQVGHEPGLEVQLSSGEWVPVPPIDGTFVVNFGNAFEAATEGAVKATIHRVIAPGPHGSVRYSIPFFQGLPLDMSVSEIRDRIPEAVRSLRKDSQKGYDRVSDFLDPRWDSLGESQLRKWIRSHKEVGLKWYGQDAVDYYTATS